MNTWVVTFDTFFECISYAYGGTESASEIHRKCVNQFAQHVFSDDAENHLAVVLWKRRLKKGPVNELALRFLRYHEDYTKKPKRLMCQWTFAALVNELYPIQVGIWEDGRTRWINNSDHSEYFIEHTSVAYVTLQHCGKHWRVMELQTHSMSQQDVTLRMIPIKLEREEQEQFCVRAAHDTGSGVRTNIKLGEMIPINDNVYYFNIEQWNERVKYQIYPGDGKSAFYKPFTKGGSLFLFGCNVGNSVLLAQTTAHDVYLYCKLPKELTTLTLVRAVTEEIAIRLAEATLK
jgi:hypothetical protein